MQKPKKIPMRMCIACKTMHPKKELVRVIKNEHDELELDTTGKKNGRGAYLCPKQECFAKAIKQKQIQRALEKELTPELEEALYIQIMRKETHIE